MRHLAGGDGLKREDLADVRRGDGQGRRDCGRDHPPVEGVQGSGILLYLSPLWHLSSCGRQGERTASAIEKRAEIVACYQTGFWSYSIFVRALFNLRPAPIYKNESIFV